MNRKILILLFLILLAGFFLRLYRFDSPIADWHSWRQADTSSVSRNFANNGFNILHPTYHDLSNVPSGLENPRGYRFVEFPIYNIAQAGLYKTIGLIPIEGWGRIVTIFSSLSSALLVFLILKRYQNETAGLIGAFFFAFLPFSIFYGRTILPDTSAAASILAGIYFFDLWIEHRTKNNHSINSGSSKELGSKNKELRTGTGWKVFLFFSLSVLFTSIALLLKPFALFFTLPIIYLAWDKFGKRMFINPYLWLFAIISILPLAGWRAWITQFPEGVPASSWLFNEGNIRFKGAYFYWVFAERIGKLILGYWGVSLFVLGLITKIKSKPLFLYSFIISSLLYLIIVARGNVQHDYYQILIIPTICIFLGLGGEFLLNSTKNLSGKYMGYLVFIVVTSFMLIFSWYYIRDYFNINNNSIVIAGEAVGRLTPKDALVIANYNGDTSFLYQTKRSGWASYQYDLEEMIKLGANYLVIANPVPSDFDFAKKYEIVESTPQYVIFNLRNKENSPY